MQFQFVIVVFVTATISAKSFCQVDIVNTTAMVKPDSAIIFKWIREPNVIRVTGMADSKWLQLKASRLQIEKTKDPFVFHVNTQSAGIDTLYVLSAGKVVFKKQFKMVNPLPIKAMLGTLADSVATTQQVILQPWLRAIIPNCKCFSGHIVARFTVRFVSTSIQEWEKEVTVLGNKLNHLDKTIRRLQSNDQIIFCNINTIDIDSFPIRLPDLTITIQ